MFCWWRLVTRSSLDVNEGVGDEALCRARASPDKPTPPRGKHRLPVSRRSGRRVRSLSPYPRPSPHLVSLQLAFVCVSGYHTGHSSRSPPPGVPRWVRVPEGVIYATITLGTACPQSRNAIEPVPAAWLSETGSCPERGHRSPPVLMPGPACR